MSELIDAAKAGDTGAIRRLLGNGADVNETDAEGTTVLMHTSHRGDLELVSLLLQAGADVNRADPLGWTALMKACYNSDLDCGFANVVSVLIGAGANIEAPIGFGVRPLMLAAGYGETAVVQTLLEAGADVLAKNEGGFTALMMVKQKFYVDVINLLHEAEQLAGLGENSCESKNAPGSNVVTFMKRPKS
ncbi:MAG: ankyrin repeat domain-containing protein [Gallionella sp.]|nr:ankyrin repeat domain-containing protein [Gallionella sp.]